MKKQLQILLAGVIVLAPLAVTAWVIWWLAAWLGDMGLGLLDAVGILKGIGKDIGGLKHGELLVVQIIGAVLMVVLVYFIGLLTNVVIFRKLLNLVERLVAHMPGAKTIYESVRDLMKLFGGDPKRMGRAVLYRVPGSEITLMGILTNEEPLGVAAEASKKVALYLPFSYMFGGLTVYVPVEHVIDAGIPVEQALKYCATAHVGSAAAIAEIVVASAPDKKN